MSDLEKITYTELAGKNRDFESYSPEISTFSSYLNKHTLQGVYDHLETEAIPIKKIVNFNGFSEKIDLDNMYTLNELIKIGENQGDSVQFITVKDISREYGELPANQEIGTYLTRASFLKSLPHKKSSMCAKDNSLQFSSEKRESRFYEEVTHYKSNLEILRSEPTTRNERDRNKAVCMREYANSYNIELEDDEGGYSYKNEVPQYSVKNYLMQYELKKDSNDNFSVYGTQNLVNDSDKPIIEKVNFEEAKTYAYTEAKRIIDYVANELNVPKYEEVDKEITEDRVY